MEESVIVFIIDCDTAEDDMLSIVTLARYSRLRAVTVVEGNIPFEREVANAVYALRVVGSTAPVYPGSRRPLVKDFREVTEVHGEWGVGDEPLSESTGKVEGEYAPQAIRRMSEEGVGLLAISPLTNLAISLLYDPSVARKLREVVIMGGTIRGRGNITPVAEYNFWVDPEAGSIVMRSGARITLVPWEVAVENALKEQDWRSVSNLGTRLSGLYVRWFSHYRRFSMERQGMRGNPHPDFITTLVALDRSIVTEEREEYVDVETCDCRSRGMTLLDYSGAGHVSRGEVNARVVYSIDYDKMVDRLIHVLTWF